MASAAAVQSWSFFSRPGITSAIFDLAFCVARTWLAVTTDLVTLVQHLHAQGQQEGRAVLQAPAASGRR